MPISIGRIDSQTYQSQDKVKSQPSQDENGNSNGRAIVGLQENGLSHRSVDSNQEKGSLKALVRVSPRHMKSQQLSSSKSKIQQSYDDDELASSIIGAK